MTGIGKNNIIQATSSSQTYYLVLPKEEWKNEKKYLSYFGIIGTNAVNDVINGINIILFSSWLFSILSRQLITAKSKTLKENCIYYMKKT